MCSSDLERSKLPTVGWSGEEPSPSRRGSRQSQGRNGPEGRARPGLPGVRRRPGWKGKGKESAFPNHRALLCSTERDPDSGPRENGEPGDRTPARAGAGCHWLPLPSPATMAGHSLARVTATASADRASPARRLRSARRRHPLLPRAERDSTGKTARAPPPTGPIPRTPEKRFTWRAGGGEDTTPRRKMRRKTVASGPGRFGKFGILVPHWVTDFHLFSRPEYWSG